MITGMMMKIKIYSFGTGSKMCEIIVDGEKHLTSDLRNWNINENNIEVCTSITTLAENSILNDLIEDTKNYFVEEIEVEIVEKDWKKYGISHTLVKNALFTKEWFKCRTVRQLISVINNELVTSLSELKDNENSAVKTCVNILNGDNAERRNKVIRDLSLTDEEIYFLQKNGIKYIEYETI